MAIPLRVLKYIQDKTLPERLPGILSLFRHLGSEGREVRDFLDAVLNYLFLAAPHLNKDRIKGALKQALPQFAEEGGVAMATIAQNLMAEGEARGMERGRLEGDAQGFERHARQTLQRMLAHKFGSLPDHFEQRIEQASQPQLDHWLDQVLDATSLENIFS